MVEMKNLNSTDYQVLERIRTDNRISRTDLSEYLDLTPAAISKIIKKHKKTSKTFVH